MIRALIRYVIPWQTGLLITTAIFAVLATSLQFVDAPERMFVMAALVLPFLVLSMAVAQRGQRATVFELGLPISGRQLFAARMVCRLLWVWVPVVAMIGILSATVGSAGVPEFFGVAELTSLTLLVAQCSRPRNVTGPTSTAIATLCFTAAGGVLAWCFLPIPTLLVVLAVANVLAFARAWAVVPASYQVDPVSAELTLPVANAVSLADVEREKIRWPWWPLVRPALTWNLALLVVMMITVGAGGGTELFILAFYLPILTGTLQRRVGWLASLPLARRTLLAVLLIGSVVPSWVGLALGAGLRHRFLWARSEVWLNNGPFAAGRPFFGTKTDETCVTLDLWQVAPKGQAPVIRSPAGESVAPPVMSILGVAMYNPYYVAPSSSDDFIDWQFTRATTAMFGRPLSRADAHQGKVLAGPPLTESPRMLVLTGAVMLMVVLYILLVINTLSWHRLRRPSARVLWWVTLVVTTGPGAAVCVIDFWYEMRAHTVVFVPVVQRVLRIVSPMLPNSLWLVTAMAIVPVAAMYLLLQWQFRGTELPGPIRSAAKLVG